ncbi:MAG: hypothetical protein MUF50_05025 [Planctomycetes bacterium]|nr:hypothetical protein [Planctomycetota bacterium]
MKRWMVLVVLLVGQITLFYQPRFLPASSYEQIIIQKTLEVIEQEKIDTSHLVICSVFSEAFYYSTGISSQDCFNGVADVRRGNFPKLVVVDEDVSRHQPEFADWLPVQYPHTLIAQQWVVTEYIEKNDSFITKYPVKWYLINI